MTGQQQLDEFVDKYTPAVAKLARACLTRMRKRLPGAVQLVYDNYNALVIGFSPSPKPSEAILSIALYPRWVQLFFLDGATLPDPHKLLQGSGKQVRGVRLDDAATIARPEVEALIAAALIQAGVTLDKPPGKLIIQSISAKQRPRRPPNER